jgi:hypothetical protein
VRRGRIGPRVAQTFEARALLFDAIDNAQTARRASRPPGFFFEPEASFPALMDGAYRTQQGEAQIMKKVRGLFFASVLLCSGGAQAFQLNVQTPPTVHQISPQLTGSTIGGGSGAGKVQATDVASPKLGSHSPQMCQGKHCAQ